MTVSESRGALVDVPDVHDATDLTSLHGATAPDRMEGGMGVSFPYIHAFEWKARRQSGVGDLPKSNRPANESQGRGIGWCGIEKEAQSKRRPLNKVKNASSSPLAIEGGYAARRAYSKRPRLSTGKLVAFRLMKLWWNEKSNQVLYGTTRLAGRGYVGSNSAAGGRRHLRAVRWLVGFADQCGLRR
jgi:hypothetical protein